MKSKFSIRKALPEDSQQIAEVHMQSWKETYPGLVPEDKIQNLDLERCIRHWSNSFETGLTTIVAEVDNKVVGFASGAKNRPGENFETGAANNCECELQAIYLLQTYHKRGIGRAMFKEFAAAMRAAGNHSMSIWMVEKNPATGFYSRMGAFPIDRMTMDMCGQPVPCVCYRFDLSQPD